MASAGNKNMSGVNEQEASARRHDAPLSSDRFSPEIAACSLEWRKLSKAVAPVRVVVNERCVGAGSLLPRRRDGPSQCFPPSCESSRRSRQRGRMTHFALTAMRSPILSARSHFVPSTKPPLLVPSCLFSRRQQLCPSRGVTLPSHARRTAAGANASPHPRHGKGILLSWPGTWRPIAC